MDTIRVSVGQLGASNKIVETSDNDVKIVFVIVVAALIALLIVSVLVYKVVKLNKHEGIKAIVNEILEERKEQDKKNGK